jgi:hypothetical protein
MQNTSQKRTMLTLAALLLMAVSACAGGERPAASPPATGAIQLTATNPVFPTSTASPTAIPSTPTVTPIPRVLLPVRGVIGPFERRGFPSGYYEGQILREFNNFDQFVGSTVAQEIGLQLDAMRSMGINTIWLTLAAADAQPGPFTPPACTVNPDLGPMFPQPTPTELTNLKALFDLVQSKGIQIVLNLSNTHMEDRPKSEIWLKSILEVVKDHPALYLVLFSGDIRLHHYDAPGVADFCGGRAEPPLWEGPGVGSVQYLKWALPLAHSLGIPYQKLSAEAILGSYVSVAQAPNQFMTDGHYWNPEAVLKSIFDELNIPTDQRTYAISFYEQHKCNVALNLPCVDESPQQWAIETMNRLFDTIGRNTGARVVAVETGYLTPKGTDWNTELTLESLVWIYQSFGIEGCEFWLWTYEENADDLNPEFTPAIKRRGPGFHYNPVQEVLQQLYTKGQTNDFKLMPDTIPPVFASAAANPQIVKNGDKVELRADLSETHLFVWVDMSTVDPTQTGQVVLLDQGDGTYKRDVSLSLWNMLPNGSKKLKITAMDFWSNVSTSPLEVEQQNPAPNLDSTPPNDDFSGKTLDGSKWTISSGGGATITQDDRLIVTTASQPALSGAQVSSTWVFPGDFDVQVDFQLGEGWASPAHDHLDGAYLDATIDGQDYRITRLRSSNEDKFLSWSSTGALSNDAINAALAGKYRLVRSATTLYLLFDIGEGWQELASTTVPAEPARINLGNGSINAALGFTSYFDHFQINSGITTYKP